MSDTDFEGRFWSKVEVRGPDECWPWSACIDRRGYALFKGADGRLKRAHILVRQLVGRPVGKKGRTEHSCGLRSCMNPLHIRDLTNESRFWSQVEKAGKDECWLWRGCLNQNGYGRTVSPSGESGLAHRVSRELVGDPIPKNLIARHTCHVRNCVNPAHILEGTQADNVRDAIAAGRMPRGEDRTGSKLKKEDVRMIRILLDTGFSQIGAARKFGVTQGTVWNIKNGKSWRHIV